MGYLTMHFNRGQTEMPWYSLGKYQISFEDVEISFK
jgi:hypothetical protein